MDIFVKDFTKQDWESYKAQVTISLKQNKMAVLSDEALLKWVTENANNSKDMPKVQKKKEIS